MSARAPAAPPAALAPAEVPALAAEDVVVRFGGTTVLDGVTLRVPPGTCVALVGESGAGKTTLLRCFNALVRPAAGRVRVGDADVAALDAVALRRRTGYVPQDGGLLPHWTLARNVALAAALLGAGDPDARARADESLAMVGLEPARFAARYPHELSGGQRQRAAVARALAGGAGVMLLDEPFGALDALTRTDMQSWLDGVRARFGWTVVLITHDVREAVRLSDRVVVLSPRPAVVRRIVPVPLTRPRPADAVTAPAFAAVEAELTAALRADAPVRG